MTRDRVVPPVRYHAVIVRLRLLSVSICLWTAAPPISAQQDVQAELLPAVREQLKNGSAVEKRRAIEILMELGPLAHVATGQLIDELIDEKNDDWELARKAILALGHPSGIECEKRLSTANVAQRVPLFEALREFYWHESENLQRLVCIGLVDADSSIRFRAAAIVNGRFQYRFRKAMPLLLTMLEANDHLGGTTLNALKTFGDEANTAIPYVDRIARDRKADYQLRLSAILALGRLGPEHRGIFEFLKGILRDPTENSRIRGAAAEAIGQMRFGDEAGKELFRALDIILMSDRWTQDEIILQFYIYIGLNSAKLTSASLPEIRRFLRTPAASANRARQCLGVVLDTIQNLAPESDAIVPALLDFAVTCDDLEMTGHVYLMFKNFLGREKSLERLRQQLDRVRGNEPHAMLLEEVIRRWEE